MVAMRHMHQYGTTSAQLAWIKVAASQHAQHNPHALLREVVTVEEVVSSPIIADPLHRLDCCVITDGGGAIVVTKPEVAKSLKRPLVRVLGAGEAVKHQMGGKVDLTYTAAVWSGPAAFAEAGVTPSDVKYVSIYDSFTITVLITLEDLGFCPKGQGGKLVADGNLISGVGRLPFNTDGGGLCNNHPGNRGGLTKVVEAVRQLRGEAHPKVQVRNCDVALAHGTGGSLATRHGSATRIMGRECDGRPRAPGPSTAGQPGDEAVLGCRRPGKAPDQALLGVRRATLVCSSDLPVLRQRAHLVVGSLGPRDVLFL
jgi:acetyl-CoA C-acetyltransferase